MPPPAKRQKKDQRCTWALSAPDHIHYHDTVWGVPLYDDQQVFEFLVLETFQAGLSWRTILRKRPAFHRVFFSFDVDRMAAMNDHHVKTLLSDKTIIRHEKKIRAAINNAQVVQRMRDQGLGLAHYFWQWVEYVPQVNVANGRLLTSNTLSDNVAKDMKSKGFKFIGSTTIYAHLQATGIINDHQPTCPRFEQVQNLVRAPPAASEDSLHTP